MAGKINLTDELKKYFGFNKFKGNQEAIINNLLDGKDTFVLMPTGGGKSLASAMAYATSPSWSAFSLTPATSAI